MGGTLSRRVGARGLGVCNASNPFVLLCAAAAQGERRVRKRALVFRWVFGVHDGPVFDSIHKLTTVRTHGIRIYT